MPSLGIFFVIIMVQLKGTSLTTKLALTLTRHRILQKINQICSLFISMLFKFDLKSYFINNIFNGFALLCNTKIDNNLQDSNFKLPVECYAIVMVTPSKNLKSNKLPIKSVCYKTKVTCAKVLWLLYSVSFIIQKLKAVGCHYK